MKTYNQMTQAERRVAICQDVIRNIHAESILPDGWFNTYFVKDRPNKQEQARLALQAGCKLCGVGAMCICKVAKWGGYNGPLSNANRIDAHLGLSDAFSEEELMRIETAYEQNKFFHSKRLSSDGKACANFVRFKNGNDRLLAICQNIIDHEGDFKPKVEYEIYV